MKVRHYEIVSISLIYALVCQKDEQVKVVRTEHHEEIRFTDSRPSPPIGTTEGC